MDNGAELKCNFEVSSIEKTENGYRCIVVGIYKDKENKFLLDITLSQNQKPEVKKIPLIAPHKITTIIGSFADYFRKNLKEELIEILSKILVSSLYVGLFLYKQIPTPSF